MYSNVPKISDRQVWANSAEPDQTASRGAVWSGSTLFAIPSAYFGCITLRLVVLRLNVPVNNFSVMSGRNYSKEKPSCSTFRLITANFFGCPKF